LIQRQNQQMNQGTLHPRVRTAPNHRKNS